MRFHALADAMVQVILGNNQPSEYPLAENEGIFVAVNQRATRRTQLNHTARCTKFLCELLLCGAKRNSIDSVIGINNRRCRILGVTGCRRNRKHQAKKKNAKAKFRQHLLDATRLSEARVRER